MPYSGGNAELLPARVPPCPGPRRSARGMRVRGRTPSTRCATGAHHVRAAERRRDPLALRKRRRSRGRPRPSGRPRAESLVRGRLVYIELDDRRRHRLARGALARRRRPSLCLRCLRSTGRRRRIALWPALPVQRPDRIGQRSRRDPWPAHALPHPLPIARRLTNFQPAAVEAHANLVARLLPPNPQDAARR